MLRRLATSLALISKIVGSSADGASEDGVAELSDSGVMVGVAQGVVGNGKRQPIPQLSIQPRLSLYDDRATAL